MNAVLVCPNYLTLPYPGYCIQSNQNYSPLHLHELIEILTTQHYKPLSLKVNPDLGIKGYRPSKEITPTKNFRKYFIGLHLPVPFQK